MIEMESKSVKTKQEYIIGETAYNHEGNFDYLIKMIDEIADLGLNAVKFHLLHNPKSYMQAKHPLMQKLKTWIFTQKQWDKIIDHSNKKSLDIISLCDDIESLDYLMNNEKQIDSIELHAVSLNDYHLLKKITEFNGRVILGIGGSTLDEIDFAIRFLKRGGVNNILLMHGFQNYPTNYTDINLSKMVKIRELFGLPVGYADHTAFDDPNNEIISILPAAMGFNILEKHYTPDLGKERIDYHAAIGKTQMKKIIELMKITLKAYGNESVDMSRAELNYGNLGPMKKAIVAKKDISKGEKLTVDNLQFKRTLEESYIKQSQFLSLLGLIANRDIREDEIIDFSNVNYKFQEMGEEYFTRVGDE
jgi:sialic acid synthase SpsE